MSTVGWTATRLAGAVRTGEVTPGQVAREHLERVAAYDGLVGAFARVRDVGAVVAEADAVAYRPDLARLPLAGVPVAVKDNVPVAGEPMRVGCAATTAERAPADHEVVRRLRAAGAVVLGTTRMPELGVFGTTDGAMGTSRNPWDTGRSPGGSSGGSAAAVASGMVPVAHGNDGMGSIRIPSACCGLVGLKPGRGVVPSGIGSVDWYGMAENGPLATTVADTALVLAVMAGREEPKPVQPVPMRLRVAVSTRSPVPGLAADDDNLAAVEETADLLASAGHRVATHDPGYPLTAGPAALSRWCAGTAADTDGLDRSLLTRRTRVHAGLGRVLRRGGWPRERWARSWQERARAFLRDHDVLLTPALAGPPPEAVDWSVRGWAANVAANARYAPYAAPWNLAGLPAAVVPAGTRADGLPRSVQLVAGDRGEGALLAVAALLEQQRPWARHAPRMTPA